jgi:hypothetical protein
VDETATGLERVLNEKLAPLSLVIERGIKATIDLAKRSGNVDQAREALALLRPLGVTAATAAATTTNLAEMTRENLQYVGALRKPGTRLASVYERYAANFDRIANLVNDEIGVQD